MWMARGWVRLRHGQRLALNASESSGKTRFLITGMGPVGMTAGLIAKKMGATYVIGVTFPRRGLRSPGRRVRPTMSFGERPVLSAR